MQSVSILCLNNPLGAWDESSLEGGIGGSETNVIGLAKLLGEKGHDVLVYNDIPKMKEFGNVWYFNKKHAFGLDPGHSTWIAWRDPSTLLQIKDRTGRKILWLHDLVPEQEVLPFIHLCDKIWVQSLFHRGTYPNIPDEKFIVLPSGIIPREAKAERDTHLLCYTSDYNRGLDVLLEIWPNYLFRYPNDKLEIAYGPQTQESIAKSMDKARGDDMGTKSWKYRWEHLNLRMKMRGITHHGKMTKQELADLYERASIMAYPSIFPETQCQVVLDAQYHGCIPVTSSLGALQETNNGGYTLPPDVPLTSKAYLDILIGAREQVSEGRRLASRELAKAYTWDNLYGRLQREILGA